MTREVRGSPDSHRHSAASPGESETAGLFKGRWQQDQLPSAVRDLLLDDQRQRNAICWSVFDC